MPSLCPSWSIIEDAGCHCDGGLVVEWLASSWDSRASGVETVKVWDRQWAVLLAGENGPILKIERSFVVKSFVAGMDFLNKYAPFSLLFSAHVIALAARKALLQTAA
jgi:hypothetical protein